MAQGDNAPDGIGIKAKSLALNGGTIQKAGSTTVNADLFHGGGSVNAQHKVDGIRPTLITTGVDAPSTSVDGTRVFLRFSEALSSTDSSRYTVRVTTNGTFVTNTTTSASVSGNRVTVTHSGGVGLTSTVSMIIKSFAVTDLVGNVNFIITEPVSVINNARVPSAPTNLTASGASTTSINLNWSAPSDAEETNVTGYRIEVSVDAGNNWTNLVANTGSTNTRYAHTGLSQGDTRHYRVSAINAIGTSAVSNIASGSTLDIPLNVGSGSGPLLVANTGIGNNITNGILTQSNIPRRAQAFTTANASGGYLLTSIGIAFSQIANPATAANDLVATLNQRASNGNPGSVLCTLTNPSTLEVYTVNTFTVPTTGDNPCPTISRNTTYFVVLRRISGGNTNLIPTLTSSNDEQSKEEYPSWSIGNRSLNYRAGDSRWYTNTNVLKIDIRGVPIHGIMAIDTHATQNGDPDSPTTMTFPIFLKNRVGYPVSVDYRTQDGTARAGGNYTHTTGSVTFQPGEQIKTVDVNVLDDNKGGYTYLHLVISNPRGAVITSESGRGRIFDVIPYFRTWDETGRETNTGNQSTISFWVEFNKRPNPWTETYTVDYRTEPATATAGTDYVSTQGTISFAPGDRDKLVHVTINDDQVHDNGESFRLVLSNPSSGASLHRTAHTAIGTILNSDSGGLVATFPESEYSSTYHDGANDRPQVVVEFNSAVTPISATTPSVELSGASVASVSAHAEEGLQNPHIFTLEPEGHGDITFTLIPNSPCNSEGICNESGTRLIQVPPTLTIPGPNSERVTPASQLSVNDASASEEDDSTIDFTVNLSPASVESVTVSYDTANGTATAGNDYTAASGTLTFNAGQTTKTLRVSIIDDDLHETDETFTLTLSNPTGAEINDATATGTITNSDQPELKGEFVGMPDNHDGSSDISFRIEFSENVLTSRGDFRDFAFTVNNGQVTDAQRVDHRSDLWTFAIEPDSNDDVHITLLGNRDCDALGSVCTPDDIPRQLANTLSATVAGPDQEASSDTAEVTTEEATEAASQLSVANATASEENDSTIDFVVTLNPASDGSVTVNYATANGTATAGDDYTAKSGTLTLNAGQTSKTIQVSIIDDAIDDDNETLTLTLTSPSGAEISNATATGTITNNEPAQDPPAEDPPAEDPVVLLTAAFVNVPADHNSENFTFELTFSENVEAGYARIRDHAFTVDGATIAKASRQTQGSNQGWHVEVDPTGNDEVTITLPATTDCDDSGAICTDDERMLSHGTSVRVAGPPAISVSDASVQEAEGAVLAFSVTLSNASSRTVVVSYATADGTATAGSDYTAASGSLTFNAGDTSQTVEVPVLTDSDEEGQETLTVTLSNASQATLDDATGTGTILNGESTVTQEDPPAEDPVVDDPPAEDPVVLLTAGITNMPTTHEGTSFTFELDFSENVKAGYARIRDHAFTINGGKIKSAVRKEQGSNQGWTITVNPNGAADITITLPPTTDCDAARAICTGDGRMLTGPTSATITLAQ